MSSHSTIGVMLYDFKIVRCGDFLQVYYYENKKTKSVKNTDDIKINSLNINELKNTSNSSKEIENRSIIRTKLNCQRIAKANSKEWKSFITLTYSENMQNIEIAKIDLTNFIRNIKKVRKDFKYIAIPEFQKRGAIHFHLLTNLNLQDDYIIKPQKSNPKYYDIKYWCKGFTSIEFIEGDIKKIVGYISKYMTKDCDSRLFGVRRFTCSQNLIKPIEEFIDINNENHQEHLKRLLKDKECIYTNMYLDNLNNNVVFKEYKIID